MSNSKPPLTKNQSLVLATLSDSAAPLSAYAILDRLRAKGLRAPLQIYRALEKLQAGRFVHRLESLNAWVACRHKRCQASGHIAFAICDSCHAVTEFADAPVSARLDSWARDHQFTPAAATIEIHGNCARCQNALTKPG